jgi:hypothetical protein
MQGMQDKLRTIQGLSRLGIFDPNFNYYFFFFLASFSSFVALSFNLMALLLVRIVSSNSMR